MGSTDSPGREAAPLDLDGITRYAYDYTTNHGHRVVAMPEDKYRSLVALARRAATLEAIVRDCTDVTTFAGWDGDEWRCNCCHRRLNTCASDEYDQPDDEPNPDPTRHAETCVYRRAVEAQEATDAP